MRKIKHWQGYGTVKAGVVKDGSCTLHIRVEGNHEQGIDVAERADPYDILYRWLVKRFDKNAPDYWTWARSCNIQRINGYKRIDGVDTETCDYYFYY